jgi:hypothetical protein
MSAKKNAPAAGNLPVENLPSEPRARELLEMWRRMSPAASHAEAAKIALLMAQRAETELPDAVAKLAFWRATQHGSDALVPRQLREALAYSAFLDLVELANLPGMALPGDVPEADGGPASSDA